jgi:hypothetical protein
MPLPTGNISGFTSLFEKEGEGESGFTYLFHGAGYYLRS